MAIQFPLLSASWHQAALPLELAAVNASHYLVFRYGLVRSGVQKAVLQQELDDCMSQNYAEMAARSHLA